MSESAGLNVKLCMSYVPAGKCSVQGLGQPAPDFASCGFCES